MSYKYIFILLIENLFLSVTQVLSQKNSLKDVMMVNYAVSYVSVATSYGSTRLLLMSGWTQRFTQNCYNPSRRKKH